MQDLLIVADIGGTKTNLCIAGPLSGLQTATLMQFTNAQHADFTEVLGRYCDAQHINPQNAGLGLSVAGPVRENRCQLTNLDWELAGDALQTRWGCRQVILLNDLVATALGMDCLDTTDLHVLQVGQPGVGPGIRGILSLGTGLGEATLLPSTTQGLPLVVPSEAGHRDVSVYDARSAALFTFALQHSDSPLVQEYLVSGMGLPRIRAFLAQYASEAEAPSTPPRDAPAIVARGLSHPDSLDAEALALLTELVAREAANLALQNGCVGEIIIAGGLAKRLQPFFMAPAFTTVFNQRGKLSDWLRCVPIQLCTNTEVPLWGMWRALSGSNQ